MSKIHQQLAGIQKMQQHALDRFEERYGRKLSVEQLEALAELARTGKTHVSRLANNGRTLEAVKIAEEWILFVYDPSIESIVTFLPQSKNGRHLLLAATDPK